MAAPFTKIVSLHKRTCCNFGNFEFNGENRLKIGRETTKIFVYFELIFIGKWFQHSRSSLREMD